MVRWITLELKNRKMKKTIENKQIIQDMIKTYYQISDKRYYDESSLNYWIEKANWYFTNYSEYINSSIFDHIICLAEYAYYTKEYITEKEAKNKFSQMCKLNPNFEKLTEMTTYYEY